MKRILIAAALALPFAAHAAPEPSFDDNAKIEATTVQVQASGIAKGTSVLPSFNDHAELFAALQVERTDVASDGMVLAGVELNYPAY